MNRLRILRPSDLDQLILLYQDAVMSQAVRLYSPDQIAAWVEHASHGNGVAMALERGHGLGSHPINQPDQLEAFGILEPADRLSLLYSRGLASRRGLASTILEQLEAHARRHGVTQLRTEASQLSRPLLLRRGWQVEAAETVQLQGVSFERWRMIKPLTTAHPGAAAHLG